MHEILQHLPLGARVLDLGCRERSFQSAACPQASVVRLDLEPSAPAGGDPFVQADAARLPFPDHCFDAVIANHSLEHMVELAKVFTELGRVLKRSGAIYISVPDSSTLSDRLYRWVYHGGGHVNPFRRPEEILTPLKAIFGEESSGIRTLHTSFGFLLERRFLPRPPRRLWLLANGRYEAIATFSFACRILDRIFGTRLSIYGWAIYYGNLLAPIETDAWSNVCIECGSAQPSAVLRRDLTPLRLLPWIKTYTCPECGSWNLFTEDL